MSIKILFWIIIIFLLEWSYLVFYLVYSDSQLQLVYAMYPFNGQLITHQTYVDYLSRHIEIIIPIWLVSRLESKFKKTLIIYKWLFVGYLVDYILTYNQPVAWFYFVPLSYGLYMAVCLCLLAMREIIRHEHDFRNTDT